MAVIRNSPSDSTSPLSQNSDASDRECVTSTIAVPCLRMSLRRSCTSGGKRCLPRQNLINHEKLRRSRCRNGECQPQEHSAGIRTNRLIDVVANIGELDNFVNLARDGIAIKAQNCALIMMFSRPVKSGLKPLPNSRRLMILAGPSISPPDGLRRLDTSGEACSFPHRFCQGLRSLRLDTAQTIHA